MPIFDPQQVKPVGNVFRPNEVQPFKEVEREELDVNGTLYSGNPNQIALWKSGNVKTPEDAGLALAQRARTWKDTAEDVTQGAGRMSAQTLGGAGGFLVGGLPGMIAGSSAGGALMEAGIKAGEDAAGGSDESGTYLEALGRGAEEGAVTGAMGGAGGFLGRLGGKAIGSLAPRLGKVGRIGGELLGETGGMAGVSAAHDLVKGKEPGLHNLTDAALYTGAGRTIGAAGKKFLGPYLERLSESMAAAPTSIRGKAASSLKAPHKAIERQKALDKANRSGTSATEEIKAAENDPLFRKLKEDRRLTGVAEDEVNIGLEAAAGKQRSALADLKAERTGLDEATEAMGGLKETERVATGKRSLAATEKREAKLAGQAELQARTKGAPKTVEEAIAAGKKRVKEVLGENWQETVRNKTTTTTKTGGNPGLDIPPEIAHPAYGFLAKELEGNPELVYLLKKHFGEEFVPTKAEIEMLGGATATDPIMIKRGSYAMKFRDKNIAKLTRKWGPEETTRHVKEFAEDWSAYMTGHPEYGKAFTAEELKDFSKVASGFADRKTVDSVMKTFSKRISGRSITLREFEANKAFDEAQLAESTARGKKRSSPEATKIAEAQRKVLSKKIAAGEVGKEYARERAKKSASSLERLKAESALSKSPQEASRVKAVENRGTAQENIATTRGRLQDVRLANPQMTSWLGRPNSLRGTMSTLGLAGTLAGGHAASVPLAIYSALNTRTGAKFLHGLGNMLAEGVPPAIGAALRPIAEAANGGDPDVVKAMLSMAVERSADVRKWVAEKLKGAAAP